LSVSARGDADRALASASAGDPSLTPISFGARTARSSAIIGANPTLRQRHEFKGDFNATIAPLQARHSRIRAGRPQTSGNVEALHRTILDECWRPAFARYLSPRLSGLRRELNSYLAFYNYDAFASLTQGRIPADIVYAVVAGDAGDRRLDRRSVQSALNPRLVAAA